MKHLLNARIFLFALAMSAAVINVTLAQEQPQPPPADGTAPPTVVQPGTPLAEVVKLAQAGVDLNTIKNYIANTPGAFGLDAEKILYLNDAGVPTDIINAMLEHDKNLYAPVAASTPPASADAPVVAPPATEVTINQFYQTLSPYGSWVEVEGYGRCWRPTTVIYDSSWQPYCDRGHWVYSDHGWYWDSDYSWGATFHYGRWFRHARFGWCWWPDTVWAPSWVTWRSHNDYCGWAPLPPFTVYRPGAGFFYRGSGVTVGFDFGLGADCFTFISVNRFSERHPRYFRAEPNRVNQFFHQTTIINNYNINNRTIVNGGIPVDRINAGNRRHFQPVPLAQIPNAERHGWRGADNNPADRPATGLPADRRDRNISPGNSLNRNHPAIPTLHNDQNNNNNPRPTSSVPTSGQSGNRDIPVRNVNTPTDTHQNVTPPAGSNPRAAQPGVAPVRPPESYQRATTPPSRSITENTPSRPPATSPPDTRFGNRDVPNRNFNTSSDTHKNITPSAGLNTRPSQLSSPPVRPPENNQRSQTPPVAVPPHNSAPSTPPANNWQQKRQSQSQTPPVISAPRSTLPSTPPPAPSQPQYQNRSASQYSDRDKQSH
ncbi:MAG: DUF6600 domain-containing protein [Verrucomicrobiota bacterium]